VQLFHVEVNAQRLSANTVIIVATLPCPSYKFAEFFSVSLSKLRESRPLKHLVSDILPQTNFAGDGVRRWKMKTERFGGIFDLVVDGL
jgi:hypothetical protein